MQRCRRSCEVQTSASCVAGSCSTVFVMDVRNSKAQWRRRTSELAGEIDFRARSHDIVDVLTGWVPLHGTVLSYLAMHDELDLAGVHELARCRIAVTRTPARGPLTLHLLESDVLEMHPLGFRQPRSDAPEFPLDEIDVVLVPGLAFDRAGNRLGRGRGVYDELLSRLPPGVVRVGIIVDDLLVDELPTEAHDQRVAWVATESGVHRVGDFGSSATSRFVEGAVALGIAPHIHQFPEGTKTSADAAEAVGAQRGEIAKSLLFDVDGSPVLVICPGDRRVNEVRLAWHFGGTKASIADIANVKTITGFAAGGTPGVGLPRFVKVVVDVGLARYRWVWSAGGTPVTVYPVALDRLVAASGARWANVTDRGDI